MIGRAEVEALIREVIDRSELAVRLRQLASALGGKSLRGGSFGVTWPGGTPTAGTQTVAHGLPAAPTWVNLTPTGTRNVRWDVRNVTDTTFDAVVETWDGSSPVAGTQRFFYWSAAG